MILWLNLNGIGCVGGVLFNVVLVIYVMCVFVSCLSAVLLLLSVGVVEKKNGDKISVLSLFSSFFPFSFVP